MNRIAASFHAAMLNRKAFILLLVCLYDVTIMPAQVASFPAPFTRVLTLKNPPMEGKDVAILQNLLLRSPFVKPIETTGFYDNNTRQAVVSYQEGNSLPSTGIFDEATATQVLSQLMYDGYRDDGIVPAGYKFKVHVPVHKDRTIETNATLFDSKNQVRYTFRARCHGGTDHATDKAINQLTRNGNTPTGLVTFDLNSPEPDPKSFGPYPVIRAVKGLEGNAAIGRNKDDTFLSDYRSGILLHTGEWDNWNPLKPMPNSLGCIHAHPGDLKKINDILQELGVIIRPNTLGKLPYPYQPQGLLSVEEIVHVADTVS